MTFAEWCICAIVLCGITFIGGFLFVLITSLIRSYARKRYQFETASDCSKFAKKSNIDKIREEEHIGSLVDSSSALKQFH